MSSTRKVIFKADWEERGYALVNSLVCTCGKTILRKEDKHIANEDEAIQCPQCKKNYKFLWLGMAIKELN